MATMKYEIPLLDCSTEFLLWKVKMHAVLVKMDLDDALPGLDKMSSLWIGEEKQCKYHKVLY